MDVRSFSLFFAMLTVAANLFVLTTLAFVVAGRFSTAAAALGGRIRAWFGPAALPSAWVVAAVATAGSLYYSEVAHYVPCRLCWYQRIGMYPLVLILGIAALRGDTLIRRYVVPLVTAGALISAYHYQLQRFPSQGSITCDVEAPCTLTWVWEFHYISIPFMALSAFALIATLLLIAIPSEDEDAREDDDERTGRSREAVLR